MNNLPPDELFVGGIDGNILVTEVVVLLIDDLKLGVVSRANS